MVLNVGSAHLGVFGSRAAIAEAKGELVEALPADGVAVLNTDDPIVSGMRARTRARVVTFGELGGPLLVFHAPRGIGKTSLLRTAQRRAEELGFVTAWVACTRERPVLPELVGSVRAALEQADTLPRGGAGNRWRKRLDKVSVEVGIPGAKVSGVRLREEEPPAPPPPSDAELEAAIDAATDADFSDDEEDI